MAAWYLDAIVRNNNLMVSHTRIRKDAEKGHSISNKLSKIKRMAAASLFLNGETRLRQGILDNVELSYDNMIAKKRYSEFKNQSYGVN